jgi:hypothetical protein
MRVRRLPLLTIMLGSRPTPVPIMNLCPPAMRCVELLVRPARHAAAVSSSAAAVGCIDALREMRSLAEKGAVIRARQLCRNCRTTSHNAPQHSTAQHSRSYTRKQTGRQAGRQAGRQTDRPDATSTVSCMHATAIQTESEAVVQCSGRA